jgi:hypothetical protein
MVVAITPPPRTRRQWSRAWREANQAHAGILTICRAGRVDKAKRPVPVWSESGRDAFLMGGCQITDRTQERRVSEPLPG